MRSKAPASGFTLIEVAISVAILGIALTTLVALQSSYLRSYQYERSLVKGALIGQYLLASWEGDDNLPTPGESSKPLIPILDKLGYFEESDMMARTKPDLDGWTLHRKIENVAIGPIENALKKIELDVVWGPGANEQFSIVYFIKGIKLPESGSDNPDDAAADTGDDTADAGGEEDQ